MEHFGQLIKVRDDWEEAIEARDEAAVKIAKKKARHYTGVTYTYLRTGVRENEK